MTRNWLIAALVFFLAGCENKLDTYVKNKFPPAGFDEQRAKSIASATAAIEALSAPNVSLGVSLSEISRILASSDLSQVGITNISTKSDSQLLQISLDFDRIFAGDELSDSAGKTTLSRIKPRISGSVILFAGVAVNSARSGPDNSYINIKFLPSFHSIKINSITAGSNFEIPILGDAIAVLLDRYATSVSGVIGRLDIMDVAIPTHFANTAASSQVFDLKSQGLTGAATVTSKAVTAPVTLKSIAPLLHGDRVVVLAQLVQVGAVSGESKTKSSVSEQTVGSLNERFSALLKAGFGISEPSALLWVAIRKDLIATSVNDMLRQAQVCINVGATVDRQRVSKKVSFPDENTVDCTPTRSCSPTRNCDVTHSHDTRNCSRCVWTQCPTWSKPFRQCEKCFNDPFCEASKASQNIIYEADYSARKADCERLKSQEKLQCETEKSAQKALCETGKEALKRLARTGKFANIDMSFSGVGNINICVKNLTFSTELNNVNARLEIDGTSDINLGLRFEPLDIIGHLTCQVPWTESQNFKATIPGQVVSVESKARVVGGQNGPIVEFNVRETQVDLRVKPGPTEFLLRSANMNLACRASDLLRPLIIPAAAFVPELRGEFKQKLKPMTFGVPVRSPQVKVLGKTVKVDFSDHERSILAAGAIVD